MIDSGHRVDYDVMRQRYQCAKLAASKSPTPGGLFDPATPPDGDELSFLSSYWRGVMETASGRLSYVSDKISARRQEEIKRISAEMEARKHGREQDSDQLV